MITIAFQTIIVVLALILLYSSAFLREDEEGRIQNVIEGWWIRLSDLQSAALSKQTAFMQTVAAIATSWFDRLFTKKILSLTAICVSLCYTLASLALGYWGYMYLVVGIHTGTRGDRLLILAIGVAIITLCLFLGTLRSFLKTKRSQRLWLYSVCTIVALFFLLGHSGFGTYQGPRAARFMDESFVLIALFAGSVICDFSFITLNRLALRWIKQSTSFAPSLGVVIGNCALAALYILIPAQLGKIGIGSHYRWNPWSGGWWTRAAAWIALANILTAFVALVFVVVAFVMLIHRVAWPLIERSVYAIARYGIFRHRKTLALVGIALLSTVFPAVHSMGKRAVEIFTG
jgi:hypothetical protein